MNIENIKSFIEFYRFLGVTNCITKSPRNSSKKINVNKQIKSTNLKIDKMNELTKNEKLAKLHTRR